MCCSDIFTICLCNILNMKVKVFDRGFYPWNQQEQLSSRSELFGGPTNPLLIIDLTELAIDSGLDSPTSNPTNNALSASTTDRPDYDSIIIFLSDVLIVVYPVSTSIHKRNIH